MLSFLSGHVFYPLWDIRDKSTKLKRLKELQKRQWLPEDALKEIQQLRLRKLLTHALDNSPFYKQFYADLNLEIDKIKNLEAFSSLPILTKHQIREAGDSFRPAFFNKSELATAKTGGSTGVSLHLYFDKKCQEYRNAAAMLTDMWSGWKPGLKRAAIWGNPPVPQTINQKLRSALLDRMIYLDTMALNAESLNSFVALWQREKPQTVFGHSHSIYMLAKFLLEHNITDLRPRGVISTSMMLLEHERDAIEQAFKCKVFNRYGCEEVGLIASECEYHNGMHLNCHDVYVEFINSNGDACKPGEEGKIVLTDLNNYAMPLIRYQVEDIGTPTDRKCSCGRAMPLMENISGRVADFLKRKDGTLVAGVSLVERTLTAIKGVEQMQLVQESFTNLTVNFVKSRDFDETTIPLLESEFKSSVGQDVEIIFNQFDNIPQEASGKFRFSICKF